MFDATADGFGVASCGVEVVEVGQNVPGSTLECCAQGADLGQGVGKKCGGEHVDVGLHQSPAPNLVGLSVGTDDALVDAPGYLECDVFIAGG